MLGFKRSRSWGERGDTIVEVLICIAVISLVLGGAFATTSKSLASTRDSQERSDSLKLVESQLEQIKGIASAKNTVTATLFSTTSAFCLYNNAVTAATSASCKVNAAGVPTTSQPMYTISITRDSTTNTFTIRSTWTSTRGLASNIQMKYRVHQ